MQIAGFTCFILIIPAALSRPQGCPCDAESPLKCKERCSDTNTKDNDDNLQALRQGQDNYYSNTDNRLKSYFRNPYEIHRQNSILDLMKENAGIIPGILPNMIPSMVPNMVNGMVPNMVNDMVPIMRGRGGWGSLGGSWV